MTVCECKNKCECTLFSIAASLILGIIAVFLNFSSMIAVTPAFLWVLFGVSIGFLAVGLLVAAEINRTEAKECLCTAVSLFLAGILATVLFSVILLTIDIAAASLIASILVGLLIGSFALILTSAACIIKNILKCNG